MKQGTKGKTRPEKTNFPAANPCSIPAANQWHRRSRPIRPMQVQRVCSRGGRRNKQARQRRGENIDFLAGAAAAAAAGTPDFFPFRRFTPRPLAARSLGLLKN